MGNCVIRELAEQNNNGQCNECDTFWNPVSNRCYLNLLCDAICHGINNLTVLKTLDLAHDNRKKNNLQQYHKTHKIADLLE